MHVVAVQGEHEKMQPSIKPSDGSEPLFALFRVEVVFQESAREVKPSSRRQIYTVPRQIGSPFAPVPGDGRPINVVTLIERVNPIIVRRNADGKRATGLAAAPNCGASI
jgi:hypothetical protein